MDTVHEVEPAALVRNWIEAREARAMVARSAVDRRGVDRLEVDRRDGGDAVRAAYRLIYSLFAVSVLMLLAALAVVS